MTTLILGATFLLLCLTYQLADGESVCYDLLGCFSNEPPWHNSRGYLPQHPDQLNNTHMIFHDKDNINMSQFLDYRDPDSVKKLVGVDLTKNIKILIHGFRASYFNGWARPMKDVILTHDPDAIVYIIAWSDPSDRTREDYYQAVADMRTISVQVKILIDQFMAEGVTWDNIHIIGHSFGCHMAGEIGRLTEGQISRITGLDPTSPGFDDFDEIVRLDKTDARFVDMVFTDARPTIENDWYFRLICGGFGSTRPDGHINIYVNDGFDQPGCFRSPVCALTKRKKRFSAAIILCHHSRAHQLYTDSISTPCPYTVYPCDSYDELNQGNCVKCPEEGCNVFGYHTRPDRQLGTAFLKTGDSKSFCRYHYVVRITSRTANAKGRIQIGLEGSQGATEMDDLPGDNIEFLEGEEVQGTVLSPLGDLGEIHSLKIVYLHDLFSETHLDLVQVSVTSGVTGQAVKTCQLTTVQSGIPESIPVTSTDC